MPRGWEGVSSRRPPTMASANHPSSRAEPFQNSIYQILARALFLHAKRLLTESGMAGGAARAVRYDTDEKGADAVDNRGLSAPFNAVAHRGSKPLPEINMHRGKFIDVSIGISDNCTAVSTADAMLVGVDGCKILTEVHNDHFI